MFNNYRYFITLAEEQNISRAAEKLFISHQCLSKYLKSLESEYRISFFSRENGLKLTPAGEAMLDTLRQVRLLEENLNSQLDDIRSSRKGTVRLGITEGRYRVLIPDVMTQFKHMYPEVELDVRYTDSHQLSELVLKGELDLAVMNRSDFNHNQLTSDLLLNEQLYLVISENMLERYFPESAEPKEAADVSDPEGAPGRWARFRRGVDLADFTEIPFVMNERGFNSREAVEEYEQQNDIHLNCILELKQADLHFMMTARDYAASFCWSMYLSQIRQINADRMLSPLRAFPVLNLPRRNQLVLVRSRNKILPAYCRDLVKLIRSDCAVYASMELLKF